MEDRVYLRQQTVENVHEWVWPIGDEGAWLGPSQEFAAIRDSIRTTLRGNKLIVQAGGCCGMYPRLFSDYFDTVVTFEPSPLSYYCLTKNCPSDKIIKYNAALGDTDTTIFLDIAPSNNVGMNSIKREATATSIEVRQMTLDSLRLPACDVIQLDIESYEAAALLGAMETIQTYRPVISLETRNVNDASHQLLFSLGYEISGTTVHDTQFSPIKGS